MSAPLTPPKMQTCACNPLNEHLCLNPTYLELLNELDAARAERDEARDEHSFWLSAYPDGMTKQDVLNELADLKMVSERVPKVYCHVTGGKLSKPTYDADVVCREADEHYEEALHGSIEDEFCEQIHAAEARAERAEAALREIIAECESAGSPALGTLDKARRALAPTRFDQETP